MFPEKAHDALNAADEYQYPSRYYCSQLSSSSGLVLSVDKVSILRPLNVFSEPSQCNLLATWTWHISFRAV